jgi:hypothetical protein
MNDFYPTVVYTQFKSLIPMIEHLLQEEEIGFETLETEE